MTYVVRTTTTRLPSGYFSSDFLMEVTRKEALELEASNEPGVEYHIVTGQMAHRYVRQGMTHGTPLYIDMEGRIRYARG